MAWDDTPPSVVELTNNSWDSEPPRPEELGHGGSFLNNAWEDVKGAGAAMGRLGRGVMDLPSDIYQSGKQVVAGQDFNRTPVMQDLRTVGGAMTAAVPHVSFDPQHPLDTSQYQMEPGSILKQYQEIGAQPLKYIPGQIGQQFQKAYPENPFYQHPVNTGLALSPLIKPAAQAMTEIPGVQNAIDSTRQAIASPFESSAQNFGRRALGLTKRFLNKSESQLPRANAAAQTALDTGVIQNPLTHPFSSGADDMLQRAESLESQSGQQIGAFLKSQGESFDPVQTLSRLEELKNKLPPDDAIANQIQNAQELVARTVKKYNGDVPFEEANKLKSYIQDKVNFNSDKATARVGQQIAGTMRSSIDNQLEDIARKSGTGADYASFRQNKKLFGDSNTMQQGLLNRVAAENGNRAISPFSISMLSGITEFVHTGNPVKALMVAGGTELAKRYGAATAATLSNDLAKLIAGNPTKYSALLQNAIQTGGPTIDAITMGLQGDPDFQQLLQKPRPIFKQAPEPQPLFRKAANQ